MDNQEDILDEAVKKGLKFYGPKVQALTLVEEMSELQKELLKHFNRGKTGVVPKILEEMGDVYIMFQTMVAHFTAMYPDFGDKLEETIEAKSKRMLDRIKELEDFKKKYGDKLKGLFDSLNGYTSLEKVSEQQVQEIQKNPLMLINKVDIGLYSGLSLETMTLVLYYTEEFKEEDGANLQLVINNTKGD